MAKTSQSHPLHVDFVPHEALGLAGALGMTATPGRTDERALDGPWARDLDHDLDRLVRFYHADMLVTLLERGQYVEDEFAALKVLDLIVRAKHRGLDTEWIPMPDGGVPVGVEHLLTLVERLLNEMRDGRVAVIHCRDGLGRSGLVACCCLVALGASPAEALTVVRSVRPGAVEHPVQRQCLNSFDAKWRRRLLARAQPMDISDIFSIDGTPQPPRAKPTESWRTSSPGNAPLSLAGAATLTYVGLEENAERAGLRDAPLRPGDAFHVSPGGALSIGRGTENDVTIASAQLSRVHCLLLFSPAMDDHLVVADLDSRNGTWIDGREVATGFLTPGEDVVLARAFRFRFESVG